MVQRLKTSQVQSVRDKLKVLQGNKCAICGHPFSVRDGPALDHDHKTGVIRGVLHLSCNQAEGRIKSKASLGHRGISPEKYTIGLGKYLEKHQRPQTKLLHPSHLTEDEKRIKRNKRATVLRNRKKATQ